MPKVLVVDDDQDLLEMVSLMLEAHEFEVKSLSNASLFFETLAGNLPDVIVMDIYMGPNDGRDICARFKSDELYSDIPIVLYSAGNIPSQSIIESKADDFIQKPFDMTSLVVRLKELADRRAS